MNAKSYLGCAAIRYRHTREGGYGGGGNDGVFINASDSALDEETV